MQHTPRVLIADDNRSLLAAILTRLKNSGFEVKAAQDGYQAVQIASRWKPDVAVLDINMPAGDGLSVQERLATMRGGLLGGVPVIYLTGEHSARVEAIKRSEQAFAVLHKPCGSEELIETIESALRGSSNSVVIA